MIFQVIRTSVAKKPYIYVFFSAECCPNPLFPPPLDRRMSNNKIIIIFGLGLDLLLYQVYVGSDGWDKAAAQLLRPVCVFDSDLC